MKVTLDLGTLLRNAVLLLAAAWLGRSITVLPILFREGLHATFAHVLIISAASLAAIVYLNRPRPKAGAGRKQP